jgi:hypothetical protein
MFMAAQEIAFYWRCFFKPHIKFDGAAPNRKVIFRDTLRSALPLAASAQFDR